MTNLSTPTINRPMPDLTEVKIGGLTLWWSFDTLIAFQVEGARPIVRMNEWSQKTGKHLNYVDGGSTAQLRRISGEQFTEVAGAITEDIGL